MDMWLNGIRCVWKTLGRTLDVLRSMAQRLLSVKSYSGKIVICSALPKGDCVQETMELRNLTKG